MQTSPLVLTTLAGLSTGLGGLLAVLCTPTEGLLAASAGFAGGVMLTASLADLMPEALAFYGGYLSPLACGGAVVSLLALGMVAAGLLGRLLPDEAALAAGWILLLTRRVRRRCARRLSQGQRCCCTISRRAFSPFLRERLILR